MSIGARSNLEILEAKYAQWKEDPSSVDPTWTSFFEGFELGVSQPPPPPGEKAGFAGGESSVADSSAAGDSTSAVVAAGAAALGGAAAGSGLATGDLSEDEISFRAKVLQLVTNYRMVGHTGAWIDPLSPKPEEPDALSLKGLGFEEKDLQRQVATKFYEGGRAMPLAEMFGKLQATYAGNIGFEFMHIHHLEVAEWLRERIETRIPASEMPAEDKIQAYTWIAESGAFEEFLHRKYVGQKRFSLEGGESLIVGLQTVLENCPERGIEEISMGMAHRGRLNVLANFLQKPLKVLLHEFAENYVPNMVAGDGDVKYHLGFETTREVGGKEISITLAANPSHLEAVNAVVEGKVRARQRILKDTPKRQRVLPVLVHGDAAFAGQGTVAEVLNLSQLTGYRTGGTIHFIVNNQIGFTTQPEDARSSDYCTDVAKMIEAPVFHVNGDCPIEVAFATSLALEFRQKFGRDVIIDIVCYRRHGHNEGDEASFTQPQYDRKVKAHPTPSSFYREKLIAEGAFDAEAAAVIDARLNERLETELTELKEIEATGSGNGEGAFAGSTGVTQPHYCYESVITGIDESRFLSLGRTMLQVPEEFNLHSTIRRRFLPARQKSIDEGEGFDWGHAEALAFGSLMTEKGRGSENRGYSVRLSGQDVRRGTFSHRHAVFYDTETRDRHIPLMNLASDQATFYAFNSLLSEAAVLGFDYGYSLTASDVLVCWEGQFGDFANGAQVMIDQFISSAESKWGQPSSMTMLLPHGYEGQGPEHSSARLERFLQLCAEGNMQVCNLTTPAQYFHVLRRQMIREEARKPLILMTPKSMLRHPEAVSSVHDFTGETCFREILDDTSLVETPESVTRLIFCSGKVYYDLLKYRNDHGLRNVAIIRIEQLYPFHWQRLKEIVARYPRANKKWVWCQEEPLNMGAWSYIAPRLGEASSGVHVRYAGRDRSSSPAAGAKAIHVHEQRKLIEDAFNV